MCDPALRAELVEVREAHRAFKLALLAALGVNDPWAITTWREADFTKRIAALRTPTGSAPAAPTTAPICKNCGKPEAAHISSGGMLFGSGPYCYPPGPRARSSGYPQFEPTVEARPILTADDVRAIRYTATLPHSGEADAVAKVVTLLCDSHDSLRASLANLCGQRDGALTELDLARASLADARRRVDLFAEYAHATEFWKIEPHDSKERRAWIAKLAAARAAVPPEKK